MRQVFFCLVVCLTRLFAQRDYSIEEKVGQLLLISFSGDAVSDEFREFLEQTPIGGVIFFNFSNGELSRFQVKQLVRQIQSFEGIPRWIAVDQEGGRVQRLSRGFTKIPPASIWKSMNKSSLILLGAQIGKELKEVGVSINFSPVLDLTNRESDVLNSRTISSSADEVITVAKSILTGFRRKRLMGVLKHFPGHGSVKEDSHTEVPITEKKFPLLLKEDLAPFISLCKDVDAIMTAHMIVEDFDPKNMVSFSSKWNTYIREELNFSGLIITDSLVMNAVKKQYASIEIAALMAVEAGSDILLLGGETPLGSKKTLPFSQIKAIHKTLCEKAKNDPLFLKRIEESFLRNLYFKKRCGLFP